ncbi:hypothetical protein HGB07_08535, partial [Candidatus Roizmanbacteria bacterium]|nr:hypothetical protein [Candidatus Roizmanbacteria bacterium]
MKERIQPSYLSLQEFGKQIASHEVSPEEFLTFMMAFMQKYEGTISYIFQNKLVMPDGTSFYINNFLRFEGDDLIGAKTEGLNVNPNSFFADYDVNVNGNMTYNIIGGLLDGHAKFRASHRRGAA